MGPGPFWAEALRAMANSRVDSNANDKSDFTVYLLILRCGRRYWGLAADS